MCNCVFYPYLKLINDIFVPIRLTSHSMYNCLHERYPETIYVSKNNQCDGIN